ncbi:sigma factor [Microbispora sp. CA-135349]|uniref:sigma factor n=1 Tax=Microbispora sp. CA-135349 TaxID=3239953 RepID=UPI003D90584F
MRDRADFERYVEQRSDRLLRTAYLFCRDWATAEDLLQTAPAKAWLAWRRVGENPDPYVYRILANTHASWWRRRWRGEQPADVLPAPPRRRGGGAARRPGRHGDGGDRAAHGHDRARRRPVRRRRDGRPVAVPPRAVHRGVPRLPVVPAARRPVPERAVGILRER